MFFKDLYIDYFKIQHVTSNIKEEENRNIYSLTLNNITNFNCTDLKYREFISKYITSMNCNIEFKAIFKDDDDKKT